MSSFGPSPIMRPLLVTVPQTSSIRAEAAGHWRIVERGGVQQRQKAFEGDPGGS